VNPWRCSANPYPFGHGRLDLSLVVSGVVFQVGYLEGLEPMDAGEKHAEWGLRFQ
jgi:hypothetical protein